MLINIHTFDPEGSQWERDLNLWLGPMKQVYHNEFLQKSWALSQGINLSKAIAFIREDIRDKYHFLVAKAGDDYAWYTSWFILRWDYFKSMATFVHPDFRRKGIWKTLKTRQIDYARGIGLEGFETVIDRVNTEAYDMMKSLWARLEPMWEEDNPLWWKVFIDF